MTKKRIIVLVLILLVLAIGGGAAYVFYLRPELGEQLKDWIAGLTEGTGEGEETGEETGEEVACEDQTYTNTHQGYEVCYPDGWYTQAFGYSQLSVGFDAAAIPEASEYGGVFVVNVSRESAATVIADQLSNLDSPTTTTVTVDSVSGIRIEGVIPADSFFFAGYREAVIMMEKFGRTYTVRMLSSPDGYATNLPLYNAFVESWKFLEGTAAAPWGDDIYLETPWPGDEASGSFLIAGSAQGAFESTIVARLKTVNGTVLFEQPITYNAPDVGELGYFNITVNFTTTAESGTLEVFHTSAMDGSILDLVSVPLVFK
ncbi:MAG: Gmad2 immunoglobulin-like domain-containing protein [Patescibacteria group bacterium]